MNLKNPVDLRVIVIVMMTNLIMGFMTYALYDSGLHGKFDVYRQYFENGVIQSIYLAAIALSILMVVMSALIIVFRSKNISPGLTNALYILIISTQIFLIWYEMYCGTIFSYGEHRDKQTFHNFGIVGSVLLTWLLSCIIFKKWAERSWAVFNIISLTVILSAHYIIYYRVLYEPWRLWSS